VREELRHSMGHDPEDLQDHAMWDELLKH
jgi:hypothetical protein